MYDPPPYNNDSPPGAPLPLGEAVRHLPAIYWRVFTRPSSATFAEEVGGARWDIVWTQLLGLMIVTLVYTILWQQFYVPHFFAAQMALTPATSNVGASSVPNPIPLQTIQDITRIATGAFVVLFPAFFFMVQGLYYFLARKMFHGQGTFLVQCHTSLLAQVPINLASIASGLLVGLVAFFPATTAFTMPAIWLYSLAVSIYFYVLQIMAMMAAHRLNAMNAAGVVFIPLAILMLFACILGVFLGVVLVYFVMMQMR
jgi:hypothetical protein